MLLAAIARKVTAGAKEAPVGRAGAEFYHYSDVLFAAATELLLDFELAMRVDRGTGWVSAHVLTQDAHQMSETAPISLDDPRVPAILNTFVGLACLHDDLPDGQDWFQAPSIYRASLVQLSRTGYAARLGRQLRWADEIDPAMRARRVWDSRNRSYAMLERDRLSTDAELAWRTMPVTIRKRFFGAPETDVVGFLRVLSHCWDDGTWRPFQEGSRSMVFGDAKRLADKIMAMSERTQMFL